MRFLLLTIPIFLIILLPIQAEARKNIEDIGIALDRTCIALIKAQLKTDCPTYEELLLIYPDTSNKRISGDFVFKDGMLQRAFPPYKNHLDAYRYEKPMTWIDPPADTRDKIKLITIATKLPYYFVDGSNHKKNNTLVFAQNFWVNDRCTQATISAEKWIMYLGLVMQHLQSGCTTNLDPNVKIYQDPIKHDPKTSAWYKYQQWLKDAVKKSKETFLLNQDKELRSPEARK